MGCLQLWPSARLPRPSASGAPLPYDFVSRPAFMFVKKLRIRQSISISPIEDLRAAESRASEEGRPRCWRPRFQRFRKSQKLEEEEEEEEEILIFQGFGEE